MPREAPVIGLTVADIAGQIGVHRNSIKFHSKVAVVRGWLIYILYVELTKKYLGRPGNLPQYRKESNY